MQCAVLRGKLCTCACFTAAHALGLRDRRERHSAVESIVFDCDLPSVQLGITCVCSGANTFSKINPFGPSVGNVLFVTTFQPVTIGKLILLLVLTMKLRVTSRLLASSFITKTGRSLLEVPCAFNCLSVCLSVCSFPEISEKGG